MKNLNKFLIGSAKKSAKTCIAALLGLSLILCTEGNTILAANAQTDMQTINEEFVFDTNSKNKVIEGTIANKEYCNGLLGTEESLKNEINKEITNRIDVCKANTEVSDTTSNIKDVVSELAQSKQIRDKEAEKIARENAEMALCSEASLNVPNGSSECKSEFKSYMAYTAVTTKSSAQYKLLNGENAYTDPTTGLRMADGRYCIALGTGYCSKIGTKIDLVLENGNVIKCILGDIKSDSHTDSTHRYHLMDGSVAEFIMDKAIFSQKKDNSGTVNWIDGFDGKILKVVIINE